MERVLICLSIGALELLKVIPKPTLASQALSPPLATSDRGIIVGTKHRAPDSTLDLHDDSEQPLPKKSKRTIGSDVPNLSADVERERQPPQVKSEEESERKNQVSSSNTTFPQSNLPTPFEQKTIKPDSIVIKDEDEDADDNLVIMSVNPISRVQPTRTQAQTQAPLATSQHEEQTQRERKKAILKMRLEQLKIEQELLEMED